MSTRTFQKKKKAQKHDGKLDRYLVNVLQFLRIKQKILYTPTLRARSHTFFSPFVLFFRVIINV